VVRCRQIGARVEASMSSRDCQEGVKQNRTLRISRLGVLSSESSSGRTGKRACFNGLSRFAINVLWSKAKGIIEIWLKNTQHACCSQQACTPPCRRVSTYAQDGQGGQMPEFAVVSWTLWSRRPLALCETSQCSLCRDLRPSMSEAAERHAASSRSIALGLSVKRLAGQEMLEIKHKSSHYGRRTPWVREACRVV